MVPIYVSLYTILPFRGENTTHGLLELSVILIQITRNILNISPKNPLWVAAWRDRIVQPEEGNLISSLRCASNNIE